MKVSVLLLVLQGILVHPLPGTTPDDNGRTHFAKMKEIDEIKPEVSVITVPTVSGTAQVLPPPKTVLPQTSGSIITKIDPSSVHTVPPLLSTSISKPKMTLLPTGTLTSIPPPKQSNSISGNIFQPIATSAPPTNIPFRSDHPVPKLGIIPHNTTIPTNKFYANFFLGTQSASAWTHPYSIAWSKGGGITKSWGLTIAHIDDNQKVFGPDPSANPAQYFINPIGIQSIVLGATELGSQTVLTTDLLTAFSAQVNLSPSLGAEPLLQFPLVQGMGFVTAEYNGATVVLQSGVLFRSITKSTVSPKPDVTKYTIVLEDGKIWLVYAWSPEGPPLDLMVVNNGLIQGTFFTGVIQVAKNPSGSVAEALYDSACGTWATGVNLSGTAAETAAGNSGVYTFSFTKEGLDSTLLMFALPHHIASFVSATLSSLVNLQLATTTKGEAQAVVADSWTMQEPLATDMGFAPWDINRGEVNTLSAEAIQTIHTIAVGEVSQNMTKQTDLNSMYFSGKALAKFAQITYVLNDLLNDTALAQTSLIALKKAFELFTSNSQQFPLVYDTQWGGLVSSASYGGDPGADFGNTYYNDHHFHYGYFIYAGALIAHVDPSWLTPANLAFINGLARDIANASPLDNYFPMFRHFDWYHGHSFAHGLYETFDGRDEESSSEDAMSSYALKMWGKVIGDANLEARGNLMLSITARSLQNYFLYESTNTIQPANIIGNKVSGILFENKIDHTTYFGENIEFVQGIHMLPLLPCSSLTRTKTFVGEEWNQYFSNGRAQLVNGGWRGVLMANLAYLSPMTSWTFFTDPGFDGSGLDGGASQTWYAALAGALGGL